MALPNQHSWVYELLAKYLFKYKVRENISELKTSSENRLLARPVSPYSSSVVSSSTPDHWALCSCLCGSWQQKPSSNVNVIHYSTIQWSTNIVKNYIFLLSCNKMFKIICSKGDLECAFREGGGQPSVVKYHIFTFLFFGTLPLVIFVVSCFSFSID